MKRKRAARRITLWGIGGYLIANVAAFFVFNIFFLSPWHYHDHEPVPIPVMHAEDNSLSISQIRAILDEIDLVYGGRKPTKSEQTVQFMEKVATVIFFPATFAVMIREFVGYMGPPNQQQQAFTLSVKRRYNHLARLAIAKGMERDGYFFSEDVQPWKSNGQPF